MDLLRTLFEKILNACKMDDVMKEEEERFLKNANATLHRILATLVTMRTTCLHDTLSMLKTVICIYFSSKTKDTVLAAYLKFIGAKLLILERNVFLEFYSTVQT